MAKKNTKFYVDPVVFAEVLSNCKKTGELTDEAAEMFLKIASGLLSTGRYMNYTQDFKDDMVSDASRFFCKYYTNYDPEKGNAFSYFNRLCANAFTAYLMKYYKYRETHMSIEDFHETINAEENKEYKGKNRPED